MIDHRRRFCWPFLLNLALIFTMAAGNALPAMMSASLEDLSGKDRLEIFEKVWHEIRANYYDPSFNGVDWQTVHERYLPLIESTKSDEEFYTLIRRMVGELHDAHTRYRSPAQSKQYKKQQVVSVGITLGELEGLPVVTKVDADSEASRAGIVPGMIVKTIDARPVDDLINQFNNEIGKSSSDRATRLLVYGRLLAGMANTTVKLGLLRTDGAILDVTLTRRMESRAHVFIAHLLASGYAYIEFNGFSSQYAKEMKEALVKFRSAPGLILDLRNNGGGDVEAMLEISGYFFNQKVLFAKAVTRTGKPISILGGLIKIPLEGYVGKAGRQLYSGPIAILVSGRTGSAGESFSAGMQEQVRATIIGGQTCGCVLLVRKHRRFKDGSELDISEAGALTANGRKLEGTGVTPDLTVINQITDLQQNRDQVLEAGEKSLRRSSPTNRSLYKWQPNGSNRWNCNDCGHQWRWTACLYCGGWSLHEEWYTKEID